MNMCHDWIWTWAKNGWQNSKKEQVKNYDLVRAIYTHLKKDFPNFAIEKVPGHSNIIGNELADALSTNNSAKFEKIFKENDMKYLFDVII